MVTTYAMAHQPMPIHYEGLLRMGVQPAIPVAAWGPRGSRESVTNIEKALARKPRCERRLAREPRPACLGQRPDAAARLIISLEEAAEMMLRAEHIGGSKELPEGALDQVKDHMRQFA